MNLSRRLRNISMRTVWITTFMLLALLCMNNLKAEEEEIKIEDDKDFYEFVQNRKSSEQMKQDIPAGMSAADMANIQAAQGIMTNMSGGAQASPNMAMTADAAGAAQAAPMKMADSDMKTMTLANDAMSRLYKAQMATSQFAAYPYLWFWWRNCYCPFWYNYPIYYAQPLAATPLAATASPAAAAAKRKFIQKGKFAKQAAATAAPTATKIAAPAAATIAAPAPAAANIAAPDYIIARPPYYYNNCCCCCNNGYYGGYYGGCGYPYYYY